MAVFTGLDLAAFFDQYLRDVRIPVLEYEIDGTAMKYRWTNCVDGFNMPITAWMDGQALKLTPTTRWKHEDLKNPVTDFRVDENFYVASLRIQPFNSGTD
jgi:hypothetical protein